MYMTDVYEEGPGIAVPPPGLYALAFGAGGLIELITASPEPPVWLRVAAGGAGLALLLGLDTSAMVRFAGRETPFNPARPARALVTDGPYRLSRNPMYVGMAALYAGAAVASGLIWSLALLPVPLLVLDRVVIPREESHLAARFGEEYHAYRSRVRRWL